MQLLSIAIPLAIKTVQFENNCMATNGTIYTLLLFFAYLLFLYFTCIKRMFTDLTFEQRIVIHILMHTCGITQ